MRYSLFKCSIPVCLLLIVNSLFADKSLETLTFDEESMNVLIRQTAMPEMGESRLETILARYYSEGLGGVENWKKIESLKVFGTLKTKTETFNLAAYQKKPNLIKITLRNENKQFTLGYNGEKAWELLPDSRGKASEMDLAVARRFIHSAHFGNYLLYPYEQGKTVSYVDTVPVEGSICHQIRVILDTSYQVDYFIDIRTYLEIKVVNTDLSDQSVNSSIFTDYIREFDMPIAKNMHSYENGEFVSELNLDEVKVNSGIMPWMFNMPN